MRVGELFNLTNIRLPGIHSCSVYSLVDSQKRNKLESKSKRYYFINFIKRIKTYWIWHPENAFVNRDVVFDDDSMLQAKSKTGQGTRWSSGTSVDSQRE